MPSPRSPVPRRRLLRGLLATASLGALAGCGFRLRGAASFGFRSLHLASQTALAQELRLDLETSGAALRVLDTRSPREQADVILDLVREQRQRVVVRRSAGGQVRELQLRIVLRFRLYTPKGVDLIPETELTQQRDISYNESQALAKEAEEALMYRDMQSDLVRQLVRRLAAVKL